MNGLAAEVARACRILEDQGHEHSFLGHVSGSTGDGRLLMKPSGLGLGEVGARDVLALDGEGRLIDGSGPVHSEVHIHTGVYRRRDDVRAVVHTHPLEVAALTATTAGLALVNQDSVLFVDRLAWYEDPRLVVTREQGDELARTLDDGRAVLLRNHGLVTVGGSVPEAVFLAVSLVNALRVQLAAGRMGELREIELGTAREMQAGFERTLGDRVAGVWRYLTRRLGEAPEHPGPGSGLTDPTTEEIPG